MPKRISWNWRKSGAACGPTSPRRCPRSCCSRCWRRDASRRPREQAAVAVHRDAQARRTGAPWVRPMRANGSGRPRSSSSSASCPRRRGCAPTTAKNYAMVDGALAMDHMTLAAAELGLGTCWIGAFDPVALRDILGLPDGVEVVGMTPLGFPDIEAESARPLPPTAGGDGDEGTLGLNGHMQPTKNANDANSDARIRFSCISRLS